MGKIPRDCKAVQHSDQMICTACGLVWDVSDPEPPECKENQQPVVRTTDDEQDEDK